MRDPGTKIDSLEQPEMGTKRLGPEVVTYDFQGREPREVEQFLTKVYAENEFRGSRTRRRVRTKIKTSVCADVALCNVSHAAGFSFKAPTDRDSFLVLSCTGGSGTLQSDDATLPVFRQRSVPISAAGFAGISSESLLTHFSIHLHAQQVYSLCAQWIGSPLEQPLVFDLMPLSPELTIYWQRIIKAMDALMAMESPPLIALVSLREHAIGLLLEFHPHNYSRFLRGHRTPSAQVVREAMRQMEERADDPVTVADIAGTLGCTVQSLHQGFLEHERTTPRVFLSAVRMKRVWEDLASGTTAGSAGELACPYGFLNYKRFTAAYAEHYGECPDETFLRYQKPEEDHGVITTGPSLTDARAKLLREYIDVNIGGRLTVRSFAQLTGMSVQNFIIAFTKAFGTTPAQYVIEKRLRKACWMIRNSQKSISTIAEETGFASQSHLTTTLKQHEGVTPTRYRKSSPI
jgi:AraC-like DNA-binding protein